MSKVATSVRSTRTPGRTTRATRTPRTSRTRVSSRTPANRVTLSADARKGQTATGSSRLVDGLKKTYSGSKSGSLKLDQGQLLARRGRGSHYTVDGPQVKQAKALNGGVSQSSTKEVKPGDKPKTADKTKASGDRAPAMGRRIPQISKAALSAPPGKMVTVKSHGRNFRMRSETARALNKLTKLVQKEFPGKPLRLTSTTGGRHSSGHHGRGTAVDFTLANRGGVPVSSKITRRVAALAKKAGFRSVLNEYIHRSKHWTGPHMHVANPAR